MDKYTFLIVTLLLMGLLAQLFVNVRMAEKLEYLESRQNAKN